MVQDDLNDLAFLSALHNFIAHDKSAAAHLILRPDHMLTMSTMPKALQETLAQIGRLLDRMLLDIILVQIKLIKETKNHDSTSHQEP